MAAVNRKLRRGKDRCVWMQDDELADVRLAGRTLVTDFYKDWIVPHEAERFGSVWDWWQHLASRDRQLPPGTAACVKEIIDVCPTYRGRLAHGKPRSGNRQRTNLCVEKLLEAGLTFDQIIEITGFTGDQLLGVDMHKAWRRIEQGASASEAHNEFPSTRFNEVRRFARIHAGEPVKRRYPNSMREEAFELLDDGLSLQEAADVLNERHGTNLNDKTVGQWHSRYRLRARKETA